MASSKPLPAPGFFKKNLLPILLVLLIPVFSIAFFRDAEQRMDTFALQSIEQSIQTSTDLTPQEKGERLAFFRAIPVSKIMASREPDLAGLQEMFEPSALSYATFRWMQRIAWVCLVTVLVTLVLVGISVAYSFRSQQAQYRALRLGWPVLRTSAVIQVVGQAVLIVALSYWVTALWFEIYVLKLIFLVAILAACAVFALVRAIFRKVDNNHPIQGELVSKADAPELWSRIESIAQTLGTAPPDRIVAGIEASFFVTEHPVTLAGTRLEGRTLFVSLPMLKIMSLDEADAVLGHELAHFSGEDTLWSKRISPLLGKFEIYLHALYNGLAVPVARFMHFFWDLYLVSIRRLSRVREFRADQVGSSVNSPAAMARALVKVASYCDYRNKTEHGIIEKPAVENDLRLALQLETGYPDFLSAFAGDADSMKSEIAHPFDTHPSMADRIRNLGFDTMEVLRDAALQAPPARTWHDAILPASALESSLWAKREEELQKYHSLAIAYRVLPETPEEITAVEKHFPRVILRDPKGKTATIDYRSLKLDTWENEIPFAEIKSLGLDESWGKKRLSITHMPASREKVSTEKLFPLGFANDAGNLLELLERYYGRHKAAHAEVAA
jgi:Zn-dependent protease with chaperone function